MGDCYGTAKKGQRKICVEIPLGLLEPIKKAVSKGFFESVDGFIVYAIRLVVFNSQIVPPIAAFVECRNFPKVRTPVLILETVRVLESLNGEGATVDDVKRIVTAAGVSEETFSSVLDKLMSNGYLYEPKVGILRIAHEKVTISSL